MAEDDKTDRQEASYAPHVPNDLKSAQWLAADHCQAVFEALESGGYTARAVGGAIRNALMGHEVSDVDIASAALPDEVVRLCRAAGLGVHPTGLAHGTLTVVSNHVPYEVTTLRRDVETHGRHATIAFTTDWSEDAARRDFTMNAIYCDRHGTLYDPLGGYPDLVEGRVRFIGSARERIREDYLRILRFFRFFAAYGHGEIDAEGLEAVTKEREGLKRLSAERIRIELLKLLVASRAHDALAAMQERGIAFLIFGKEPHLDRFDKLTGLELAMNSAPDPILRLAALLLDDENDARNLAARLRLSNEERNELSTLARYRVDACATNPILAKTALYRLGEKAYRAVCLLSWAQTTKDEKDPDWRAVFDLPRQWNVPAMPFKGSDVLGLGIPPGPDVGKILTRFEDWWIEAGFPEDEARLRSKLAELGSSER